MPKKLNSFDLETNFKFDSGGLAVDIDNPVKCPLKIDLFSNDNKIDSLFNNYFPINLKALEKISISIPQLTDSSTLKQMRINYSIGNPGSKINLKEFTYPFPKNKKYKILQGNNGSFSHQSNYSRYAVDFYLRIGDTICAAADGYVVGIIQDYEYGENDRKWRDYANYITLYHPTMNVFTQYVHLNHKGSFVELNDSVSAGDPIAISGNTGFTSGEHLHFSVLFSDTSEVRSTPFSFKDNISSKSLKKGDFVKH